MAGKKSGIGFYCTVVNFFIFKKFPDFFPIFQIGNVQYTQFFARSNLNFQSTQKVQ